MKKDLEDLLDEIKDRMDYYLRKADDPNFVEIEQSCIVTKLNSGTIQENIKFPSKYRDQINDRLLKILCFENLTLNPKFFINSRASS